MNIVLMGYRCTGKSTAGRLLAGLLGLTFHDTDPLVEKRAGRTIPEIVAGGGWPAFRTAEAEIIRELAQADDAVIALGGGAVLDPVNVERLRESAIFVWLHASLEQIAARMAGDEASGAARPSLTGKASAEEIRAVLTEREPLYRRLADLDIDTTAMPATEVAERIRAGLEEGHTRRGSSPE
jgi:shikimate kinase